MRAAATGIRIASTLLFIAGGVFAQHPFGSSVTTTSIGRNASISLPGLGKWLADKDVQRVRLFIDTQELHGLPPRGVDIWNDKVVFDLDMSAVAGAAGMTPAQRAGWIYAFRMAHDDSQVTAGIGLEGGKDMFTRTTALSLHMPNRYIVSTLLLVVVVLGLILYLGSDLVRESMPEPLPSGQRWCISLGRCQMAMWFVLVVGAYIYLYFVTQTPPVITTSVLTLIGISAATGLSAMVVDVSKREEQREKRRVMYAERAGLANRIEEIRSRLLPPQPLPVPVGAAAAAAPALAPAVLTPELAKELQEKEARLAQLRGEIQLLPSLPPPPTSSGKFLNDILQENGSVSFHRLQMAVWTLVLGIIFVVSVYREYMMPEFDTTLLGLMGISSGTYLGFKIPDKSKPPPSDSGSQS